MTQLREVSTAEKIIFPLMLLILVALMVPSAAPLLGMFCFGNLMKECGVVETNFTTQNALINITTIFLGLAVGSKLQAEKFLVPEHRNLALGMVAFAIGTMTGLIMAKLMNLVTRTKVNPLLVLLVYLQCRWLPES